MMRLGITNAVKHLIIINVVIFIGMMTIGSNGDVFNQWLALYFPENDLFKPWQVITHMFMHSNQTFAHILFNMFGLWMFGTAVERQIGTKKFLFIYFSAGFGAVLFQLGFNYFEFYSVYDTITNLNVNEELLNKIINIDARDGNYIRGEIFSEKIIPILNEYRFDGSQLNNESFEVLFNMNAMTWSTMVGASGCIMGVLAAFGVMNPNAELMLIFLPIPVKAKYFIPAIIGLDVISAFTGQSFFSPSNTAYAAHIGGAIVGFIIMWYWKKNSMNKYRWD